VGDGFHSILGRNKGLQKLVENRGGAALSFLSDATGKSHAPSGKGRVNGQRDSWVHMGRLSPLKERKSFLLNS